MLVLIRPANQMLLPVALVPLLAPVAWRRRLVWSAACSAAPPVLPLAAWALHNGVRYDDATGGTRGHARGSRSSSCSRATRPIAPENGPSSTRLARLIEEDVLAKLPPVPIARRPSDTYLQTGSNYETVRLIALSDRVLGRDENYDLMFDSAVEAISEHPSTYVRGVAETFWEFLRREAVARGDRTADFRPRPNRRCRRSPRSAANSSRTPRLGCSKTVCRTASCGVRPTTSTRARSSSRRTSGTDAATTLRYREIVAQVRDWDAQLPSRVGVSFVPEVLNRITPRFPTPILWIVVGLALARRAPAARLANHPVLSGGSAFLVLLIHAASQGVAPEFALPLYPVFIVTALAVLAGVRRSED